MKRIDEIPLKELGEMEIKSIVAEEIFEIANQLLPEDCFWRQGEKIHIEILKFLSSILEEETPISTESICFYCSVQQSSYYEHCRHKKEPPSQHFH